MSTYRAKTSSQLETETNIKKKIAELMNHPIHKQYNIISSIPLFKGGNSKSLNYIRNISEQTDQLPTFDTNLDKINFSLVLEKDDIPKPISELGDYKKLYKIKDDIDQYHKIFYKFIRLTNPFELVNSIEKRHSVMAIKVISRAYFKLWEILAHFKKEMGLLDKEKIVYGALAEGPGGFIQSVLEFREKFSPEMARSDEVIGITLRNEEEPSTKWDKKIGKMRDKLTISYGNSETGDGNLLNPENILEYAKQFSRKADIVTADGGFRVKYDLENYKEQLHIQLFYNEIIAALKIQRKGGSFILKIYDIFTLPTIQLIYLLTLFYDQVYITKPVTSRPANSEKYIVSIGFNGISDKLLDKLFKLSDKLFKDRIAGMQTKDVYYIHSFFDNEVPIDLFRSITDYNKSMIPYQIKYIHDTLILIEKFGNNKKGFREKDTRLRREFSRMQRKYISKQRKLAVKWGQKYKVRVKSRFLRNI